ncbi:MAG: hypothetical protein EXR72_14565 [Myxococcales bacterium]|nr:hypothetical protein [Myxococcales bacterium]
MLLDGDDAIRRLKAKFDAGLTAHLERLRLAGEREVDAFLFANFTTASAFTPHHNHLIEADFVAIYYAKALAYPNEDVAGLYYAMDPGILVLHDPRGDAGLDGRTPGIADHHKVYPRANRMVIHPGYLSHSVTPSPGGERLALTCCFVLDKSGRYRDYVSYRR